MGGDVAVDEGGTELFIELRVEVAGERGVDVDGDQDVGRAAVEVGVDREIVGGQDGGAGFWSRDAHGCPGDGEFRLAWTLDFLRY